MLAGPRAANDIRKYVSELAALAPDVILASGSATVGPLLQATRTVPIVFVLAPDPVAAGFVGELGSTGRQCHRFHVVSGGGLSGKWLELLKEIAPRLTRVAVLRDCRHNRRDSQVRRHPVRNAVARGGGEPGPELVADASEIERAIAAFARSANDPARARQNRGEVQNCGLGESD